MTTRDPSSASPRAGISADSPEVMARIAEGTDLVAMISRQIGRTMGKGSTSGDLKSYGNEGLLLAARTFDPERGVPFRRWATLRIRGTIIDGLRSIGGLPRHAHRALAAIEAGDRFQDGAMEDHAAQPPATAEAADARLTTYLAGIATAMTLGFLGEAPSGDAGEVASRDLSPEEDIVRAELVSAVRAAVADRPEAERALLERHYFGEVTLDEAAKELGFSRSWASRLHTRAIEAIAKDLKKKFPTGDDS